MTGGLFGVNVEQMRRAGPNRPRLADLIRNGNIVYTGFDPNDDWIDYEQAINRILTLRALGKRVVIKLDCEDLSNWLAAEMVVDGTDVNARPVVRQTSMRGVYHVTTDSPVFGNLDPSEWAGMREWFDTYRQIVRYVRTRIPRRQQFSA